MNEYEKMISVIRREAKRGVKFYQPKLATMTSRTTCTAGELDLDEEDLQKAENLELKKGDDVLVIQVTENKWIILCKVVNV